MKKSSILDYFMCKTEINKVNCPACNALVLKMKLNEHLDSSCKSTITIDSKIKLSNSKVSTSSKLNLKNQRKKITRPQNVKNLKNKNLKSDSDDDIFILKEIPGEKVVGNHSRSGINCFKKIEIVDSLDKLSLPEKRNLQSISNVNNEKGNVFNFEAESPKTDNFVDSASTSKKEQFSISKNNPKRTKIVKELNKPAKLLKLGTEDKTLNGITTVKPRSQNNQNNGNSLSLSSLEVESSMNLVDSSKERNTFELFDKCCTDVNEITENINETNTCEKTVKNNKITINKNEKLNNCIKAVDINADQSLLKSNKLADMQQCLDDMSAFSELSDGIDSEPEKKIYIPYYIANFRYILGCVLNEKDNEILFNAEDINFVNAFNSLSDTSQKIYVRLFQRKYKWLRIDKISYPEITPNPFSSLEELTNANLVDSGSNDIDLETALNLLSLPEAKVLAKHFNFNSAKSKEDIKGLLMNHSKQHKTVFFMNGQNSIAKMILKKVKQTVGPCYRLSLLPKKLFTRILMLFNLTLLSEDDDDAAAGGQQQQLLTLLQVNKGELVFPEYKQTKEVAIFANREELIRYEEARQLETDIFVAMEHKKFEKAKEMFVEAKEEYEEQLTKEFIKRASSLPVFLKRYTSFHVLVRCMTQGVEVLQKLREYKEAVALLRMLLYQKEFCQDYKGRWYDRLALNLEQHLKKPQEALEEIRNALKDKNVRKGHRYSLLVRALRITKSLDEDDEFKKVLLREADVLEAPKVIIKGRLCPRSILGRRHVFISSSSVCSNEDEVTVLGVEQLTLEHYKEEGFPEGIHGEGSTFISLYALLFWDIIYDGSIPDVFICRFQTHPLDLNSDLFFVNRKKQITSHLEVIKNSSNDELKEIVKTTWENHHGKSSLVSWDRFTDLAHVQGLVACFGSSILCGICERLAKDFRFTRSGVPDLVVWNPESLAVKIVEVKGPGDKLSSKQILWLDYLLRLGADAEVCLVEAEASKKLRK